MDDVAAPELLARVTERLREQVAWASSSLEVDAEGILPSLRPLHDLQAWCDALFADAAIDGSLTLVFLLDHLLEEAFENLAGEFRYDPEADNMRRGFFNRLGQALGALAQSDLSDPTSWARIVDSVLVDYTDVLAKLNQHQLAQLGLHGRAHD